MEQARNGFDVVSLRPEAYTGFAERTPEEIAEANGFRFLTYLREVFRRTTGMTKSVYRKAVRLRLFGDMKTE